MSNYLLLSVRTSGECMEDVGYALVEIPPDRASGLLRRMSLARHVSRMSAGFLSLQFWDSDVEWIACSEELEEILGGARDGGFVVLDERPECVSEQLVECGTLVVYTHEVFWKAFVKHTNASVESAWVTMGALEGLRE